jgi:tRNA G18 (ribose-2'-O)-methylase SpoU
MNAHTLNPLSFYKSLHDARGRREAGAFLVEGVRAITQIAQSRPDSIIEIVAAENNDSPAFPGYPVRRKRIHNPQRTACGCQDSRWLVFAVAAPKRRWQDSCA